MSEKVRAEDVVIGGWKFLCDILTSSRDMWCKRAQQLAAENTELRAQLRALKDAVR